MQNDTESLVGDYSYSGVNLMTYQLAVTRSPPKDFHLEQFTATEYATIYDSLLAFYHGIRLHYKDTGSCTWAGKTDLIDKLTKVRQRLSQKDEAIYVYSCMHLCMLACMHVCVYISVVLKNES